MKETFENWTAYDNWLIQNYSSYNIYKVNEINGKIEAEFCNKGTGELEKIIEESKKKAGSSE